MNCKTITINEEGSKDHTLYDYIDKKFQTGQVHTQKLDLWVSGVGEGREASRFYSKWTQSAIWRGMEIF
jgi:hypothetical protein